MLLVGIGCGGTLGPRFSSVMYIFEFLLTLPATEEWK